MDGGRREGGHLADLPRRRPGLIDRVRTSADDRRWSAAMGVVAVAAMGVALGLVVGLERREAPLTRWWVVAMIAGCLLATIVAGRGRQRRRSGRWAGDAARRIVRRDGGGLARRLGVAVWVGLVAAVAGWDAFSFSQQRAAFPTLSHFVGLVSASGAGRGLLATAWVAWGAWVAAGWRVRR